MPSGTGRACAGQLLNNMRGGQSDAVLAALREIADAQPDTETPGAKRLVAEIEAARAAMRASAARRNHSPAETARALHDRDREGDDWRKQATNVGGSAARAARREGKSEAAQAAARAKARDDHIAAHGVPSGTARVCAGTLLFNMRAGQRDAVLAALREIADAQPETETRGAKRLVTEIEAARAAEQPV